MQSTPDINYPCPACNRYVCRCAEAPEVNKPPQLELARMRQPGEMWAPWMAAQASNA